MTSEPNPSDYDFALSDKMNEKLKVAVMLLDEVRFKLARDGEKYTREFMNELTQGTKQITDAIHRLDQPPIIQQQAYDDVQRAGDSMPNEKCFLTECVENRITLGVLEKFLSAYGWLWHQCYAEGRIDESVMKSAKQNVAQYVRQFGWKIHYGKMKCKVVTRSRLVIRAGDWD